MSELTERDSVFYRNVLKKYPLVERGEGIYIWDASGKRYIDGSGGSVVVSIGHSVPEIREAMVRQAEKISFAHGTHFTSQPLIDLSREIVDMAPGPGYGKVYFLSGGSEAIETAVKMARQYFVEIGRPEKYKVISRWTSFHGNTLGTLAFGGHTKRRQYYLPLIKYTPHIPPANCYRCPWGKEPSSCELECALELEAAILREGPDSVMAFLAEPVVGATAGVLVPKDGYWQKIDEICRRYDVLIIVDEVMTGVGRTGKNFCIEHWGVQPHMIVMAKGLSSGYTPIGAVLVKNKIYDAFTKGDGSFVHGHTYSQNPLSAAICLEVLRYIKKRGLVARSAEMGRYLHERLRDLLDLPIVGDVRCLGLFAGVELVKDKASKATFAPADKVSQRVAAEAFEMGLITYPGNGGADGINGDHVLLAPPFIIRKEELDQLVGILRRAIEKVQRTL